MRAFTRAVSRRLAECQLTHLERVPIDPAKAAEQHADAGDGHLADLEVVGIFDDSIHWRADFGPRQV